MWRRYRPPAAVKNTGTVPVCENADMVYDEVGLPGTSIVKALGSKRRFVTLQVIEKRKSPHGWLKNYCSYTVITINYGVAIYIDVH